MPATARKPRKPVERLLRLALPAEGRPAILALTMGHSITHYIISEVGSDLAIGERGFQLDKMNAECPDVYHVRVEADGHCSCCCRGYEAHQHCKHADAIAELLKRGELPTLPPPAPLTHLPGYDEWVASIDPPTIGEVIDEWARGLHDAGLERVPTEAELARAA
jgi:hypothetical protein